MFTDDGSSGDPWMEYEHQDGSQTIREDTMETVLEPSNPGTSGSVPSITITITPAASTSSSAATGPPNFALNDVPLTVSQIGTRIVPPGTKFDGTLGCAVYIPPTGQTSIDMLLTVTHAPTTPAPPAAAASATELSVLVTHVLHTFHRRTMTGIPQGGRIAAHYTALVRACRDLQRQRSIDVVDDTAMGRVQSAGLNLVLVYTDELRHKAPELEQEFVTAFYTGGWCSLDDTAPSLNVRFWSKPTVDVRLTD